MPKIAAPPINLKEIRTSRRITQEQLALKIGIKPSSIAMIENNKRGTSVGMVIQIMDVLCCKFEDLYPTDKRTRQQCTTLIQADGQILIV